MADEHSPSQWHAAIRAGLKTYEIFFVKTTIYRPHLRTILRKIVPQNKKQ